MIRLLAILAVALFSTAALKGPLERAVLYPFDSAEVAPKAAGLHGVSAQSYTASDGTALVIWTAPPQPGKPVIFYLHGNAGNLAARAGRFQRFLARGYGLFAPAHRGSSGSGGTPSEQAISADIRALWRGKRAVLPASGNAGFVIYGESLGTGVAVAGLLSSTATDTVKGAGPPSAVVLEAPFTSIPAVAAHAYPALAPLADQMTDQWNSLRWAHALSAPLLVIHGTDDTLIPIEQGRHLFSAAPSKDKQFIAVQGAGHTDLWRSDVLPRLWRFVDAQPAVSMP